MNSQKYWSSWKYWQFRSQVEGELGRVYGRGRMVTGTPRMEKKKESKRDGEVSNLPHSRKGRKKVNQPKTLLEESHNGR